MNAQPPNQPCLQLEAFRRKKEAGSSRTQTPANSAPASANSAAHDTAASTPQQQTAGQGSSQTEAGPASPPRPALHPPSQVSARPPSSESSPDRAGHSYANGGLTGKDHVQADEATWFDNPVSAAVQSSPAQQLPPVSAGQADGAGEQDGWGESLQGWDDLDLGLQGVERQSGKPVTVQQGSPVGVAAVLHVLCVQCLQPHRSCQGTAGLPVCSDHLQHCPTHEQQPSAAQQRWSPLQGLTSTSRLQNRQLTGPMAGEPSRAQLAAAALHLPALGTPLPAPPGRGSQLHPGSQSAGRMRGQTCLPAPTGQRLAVQLRHSLRSCSSSWLLQGRRGLSCRTRWGSSGSSLQGPAFGAAATLAQVHAALQIRL